MERTTLMRVLVASPGDTGRIRRGDERSARAAVRDAIHEWNLRFGHHLSVTLLPILWETSGPVDSSMQPQTLLNQQLVDKCDICIGLFDASIGTPTETHAGGAVEEIDRSLSRGIPTMVCFCEGDLPRKIKSEELKKLEEFRTSMARNMYGTYTSADELHAGVSRGLEYLVTKVLEASLDSPHTGTWIEVKSGELERPFSLVDITRDPQGKHGIIGCSYTARGERGIRWPAGEIDFTFGIGTRLYHAYDAEHGRTSAIGVSCFDVERTPSGRRKQGSGFYVQHVQGSDLHPDRVDFELVEVDARLARHLIGKDALVTERDRSRLVQAYARDRKLKRIVITGGPYSGKSAVIKLLEERGARVTEEAAMRHITRGVQRMGFDEYHAWRKKNFLLFEREVFALHLAAERELADSMSVPAPVFQDRCGIDCIAYLRRAGLDVPQEMFDYAHSAPIEQVYVLDTIEPFDERRDTGRTSSLAESHALRRALIDVYSGLDLPVEILAQGTLEGRVDRILSKTSMGSP